VGSISSDPGKDEGLWGTLLARRLSIRVTDLHVAYFFDAVIAQTALLERSIAASRVTVG